jgi:hypothetical protein
MLEDCGLTMVFRETCCCHLQDDSNMLKQLPGHNFITPKIEAVVFV